MATRYFLTINASHPYIADGLTFLFEPVQNRGGSWLGVLAVEEDSAASALASASLYGVDEITLERYETLKKKLTGTPIGSSASPPPRRVRTPGANVAGVRLVEPQAGTRGVGNPLIPRPAPVVAPESVSLQTTEAQPPFEPLLDEPVNKTKKRYTAKPV